jgi:hypothetical protein
VQLSETDASVTIKSSKKTRKRSKSKSIAAEAEAATFLEILEKELAISPEVSRKILTVAQSTLVAPPAVPLADAAPQPESTVESVAGTVEYAVAALDAPGNVALSDDDRVTVTLTLDAGDEDTRYKVSHGPAGLRRRRLLRLQQEAISQGGQLTQADLARLLNASVRTIRRDIKALTAEGHTVRTRGQSD